MRERERVCVCACICVREMGGGGQKVQISVIKLVGHGGVTYNIVTVVNNTVLHI